MKNKHKKKLVKENYTNFVLYDLRQCSQSFRAFFQDLENLRYDLYVDHLYNAEPENGPYLSSGCALTDSIAGIHDKDFSQIVRSCGLNRGCYGE